MHVQEILDDLKHLKEGHFPKATLGEAIVHQQEITPHLLDVIRHARECYHDLVKDGGYMGHIYAMFLLAQFREKRAYPLIVDLFSIPGEDPHDIVGDFLTEDLGRILASVSDGDTSLMAHMIEDESLEEFTRGAAMQGLLVLVAQGALDRESALAYFGPLFQDGLRRQPSHVWDALVSACLDLWPVEILKEIRQAFEEGLVSHRSVSPKDIETTMALGKDATLRRLRQNRHHKYVEDVIAEMEWWACFDEPKRPKRAKAGQFGQIPAKAVKIGRNQPCPCGSGKKYKKCCGGPS